MNPDNDRFRSPLENIDRRLFEAAFDRNHDHVVSLIAQGADVNARNEHGATPLHTLCASDEGPRDAVGSPEDSQDARAIAALVGAGADVNARDDDGRTPLHETVLGFSVNPIAAEVLLVAGADPLIADNEGLTPLDIARSESRKIAELMEQTITASGRTPPSQLRPASLEALCMGLPDGPNRLTLAEWTFTVWSAGLQLAGAYLLWTWGKPTATWVWIAMTPVNVLLMIAFRWAMREPLLGRSTPAVWGSFASSPLGFAAILALHRSNLDWIVWVLVGVYLSAAVMVLLFLVSARRKCDHIE